MKYTKEDLLAALAKKKSEQLNTYSVDDIQAALAERKRRDVSKTESALRGAAQGATFDFGDEIAGGLAALGSVYEGGNILDNAKNAYVEQRDQTREANRLAEEANPLTYTGANLIGGIATPGGVVAKGAVRGYKGLAKIGAGSGILQGAGSSEAELGSDEMLMDVGAAGAIGTVAGPVAGRIINPIADWAGSKISGALTKLKLTPGKNNVPDQILAAANNLEDDVRERFASNIKAGLTPEQSLIKAQADKLGVRLSAGDITQNVMRQGEEDLALKGVYGTRSMGEAQAFRQGQQQDIANLGRSISEKLGRNTAPMPPEADVATAITGKLKSSAKSDKAIAQDAYKAVSYDSSVRPEDVKDLPNFLNKALEAENVDIEGIPAISRRLKEIGAIVGGKSKSEATGLLDEAGNPISSAGGKNITLATADNFRKRITASVINNTNKNEVRALSILKDNYDNYFDSLIDKGLVQGDPKVIDQLKGARGLWRDYKTKYYGRDGKALVGKIVDNNYTPEQTVNFIIGSSDAGAKKEAAAAVLHLKKILGAESPEFTQLKQLQFTRLFGDNLSSILDGDLTKQISGEKFAKNVDKLLSQNRTLARSLYTPEELDLIKNAARVAAQATARKPGSINYSATTPVLLRFANQMLSKFGPVGQYAAGAVDKATKGVVSAKKEFELSRSFAGEVTRDLQSNNTIGRELNPFAQSLAIAAGRGAGRLVIPNRDNQAEQRQATPKSLQTSAIVEPETVDSGPINPVQAAISSAADLAGIEEDLLTRIAQRESNLNPNAKNPNSSAAGLLQLTDASWNSMVQKHGPELGITKSDKLDPEANAKLGALLIRDNRDRLKKIFKKTPSNGEIYIAHFMGLPGAKKLIENKDSDAVAAKIFPKEARANRRIFFDGRRARSVAEVYAELADV